MSFGQIKDSIGHLAPGVFLASRNEKVRRKALFINNNFYAVACPKLLHSGGRNECRIFPVFSFIKGLTDAVSHQNCQEIKDE